MILYHTEPDCPVIEISVEGKITDHDLREAIERVRGDLELNGKSSGAIRARRKKTQRNN